MKKPKIKLGCDPEMFAINAVSGVPENALKLLPNGKDNPIVSECGTFAVYHDNALVEFRMAPTGSIPGFANRVAAGINFVRHHLPNGFVPVAHAALDMGHCIPPKPAPNTPEDQIPKEWEIGCMPSLNVYEGSVESKPAPFPDAFRTGSFHIHIGNANAGRKGETFLLTKQDRELAVRLLDLCVAVPLTYVDRDFSQANRRKIYGKAGEYREKDYGLEWRVLGNYFLRSRDAIRTVAEMVHYTITETMLNQSLVNKLLKVDPIYVRQCIDKNDSSIADEIQGWIGAWSNIVPAEANTRWGVMMNRELSPVLSY